MKLDPSTIAANLSAAAAAEAEALAAASSSTTNMPMLTPLTSTTTLSSSSSIAMASSMAAAAATTTNQSISINSNLSSSLSNPSQQQSATTTTTNMTHHSHHHSTQPTSTSQSIQNPGTIMTNNTNMNNAGSLPTSTSMVNKITPKDSQIVAAILKEMSITEYEPRVLPQLVEFAYRYVARVLEDSQLFSSYARKKVIDTDDVSLAIQMQIDRSFVGPPSRDILLEISRNKNTQPLPPIKSHNGMRLPADRYSLVQPNFRLISKPINTMTTNQNQNNNTNKSISINNKSSSPAIRQSSSSLLSNTGAGSIGTSSSSFVNSKISIQSPNLASPNTTTSINQNDSIFGKRKLDDI